MNKNTLVISDVHLASDVCKANALRKFLKSQKGKYHRLIILGDLFDNANFSRLKGKHWDLLDEIRHISKNKEVVWVEGNHDSHLFTRVISHMIGAEIVPQNDHYELAYNNRKILFMHGHQFDTFISDMRWWILATVATKLYEWIQRIDNKDYTLSRFVKRKSKLLLKVSKANMDKAWDYARKHGYDVIVCGHTHHSVSEMSDDGILYINTGSWVDNPCTYAIVDENGEIKRHLFFGNKEEESS